VFIFVVKSTQFCSQQQNMMARRSDHSQEEIREMAIKASRSIIIRKGLSALSARKIASEIGYTPGTLYLIFKNQDDLILHINAITLQDLHKQLVSAIKRCRKPESCILKLGHEYVRFAVENRYLWNAIFEHRLPDGQKLPGWFRVHIERLYNLVEVQLESFNNTKRFDTHLAATALWSGVHGICVLGLTDKIENSNEKLIQSLVDSLINNYLAGLR